MCSGRRNGRSLAYGRVSEDRRDEPLHVGRATTVEAVPDGRQPERIAAPLLTLNGDDIRVGGEQNSRLIGRAEHGIQVEAVGA